MLREFHRTLLLTTALVLILVGSLRAQSQRWMDDPGQLGHYAIGHTSYFSTDKDNGNRPTYVGVWYPVDARSINYSTPPAQYPLDPYTGTTNLPITLSTDWEPLGYDRAYEGPTPSKDGAFPLLVFSPGKTEQTWQYVYIGTRLASHGYVVAVTEHWGDCQWSWSACDDFLTNMVNRPRDMSFAITQLLAKSRKRGELLSGSIDPKQIAASGHSIGVYASYALAGGDNLVCDTLWPVLLGVDSLPYPTDTCVGTPPDHRISAIVALDGLSSQALHYKELSRISVPSLIMGETFDQMLASWPDMGDWNARPHAAIDRRDSYRVDINGSNHGSFDNTCDGFRVWFNIGLISADDLTGIETSWPCASTGFNPVTISPAEMHEVVTKYMVAFLDIYLSGEDPDWWLDRRILSEEYALDHKPQVQFFESEHCQAAIPDKSYFRYRPYQVSSECDVAQKDPTGWFASAAASSNSDLLLRPPAISPRDLRPPKPF